MLVLILLVALFNLIAPLYLLDFIAADRDVFWDKGSAYALRQPWWIGWPAILAWIATFIWILLEFPNRYRDAFARRHDQRADALEAEVDTHPYQLIL